MKQENFYNLLKLLEQSNTDIEKIRNRISVGVGAPPEIRRIFEQEHTLSPEQSEILFLWLSRKDIAQA